MAIASNFPAIRPSLDLNFAAGNFDPRITFSRASAATYYDGKTVAKAEENLLKYSQELGSASWVKPYDAILENAVSAPDGTITADTLRAAAVNNYHTVEQLNTMIAANTPMAVSVYAKSGTHGLLSINIEAGMYGWVAATFDLSAGTVTKTGAGTSGAYISSSISPAGNGWYRLSLVGQATTPISKVKIALASSATPTYANYANDVWTPAGTESVYLWGAQLEQRSQVTAYTPTTSAPITNYIPVLQTAPANVPRIDHDPVTGECKGLLIEEQRTNLLTYSEQFDNAAWVKSNTTVLPNTLIAPDGTLTADSVRFNLGLVNDRIDQPILSIYPVQGSVYTYSVWLKGSGTVGIAINTSDGTGGGSELTIVLSNTWQRYSVSHTFLAGVAGVLRVHGLIIRSASNPTVSVWGAQLEAGSFPTSYIKTEASQVTRAADAASMTGANFSSWYRQDEGTMFVESTLIGIGVYATYPVLTYGVNTVSTVGYSSSINLRGLKTNNGGATDVDLNLPTSQATNKTAMATASNDVVLSANGLVSVQDTFSSIPALNGIAFVTPDSVQVVGAAFIKRVSYYPKRLSNAQLQALTA